MPAITGDRDMFLIDSRPCRRRRVTSNWSHATIVLFAHPNLVDCPADQLDLYWLHEVKTFAILRNMQGAGSAPTQGVALKEPSGLRLVTLCNLFVPPATCSDSLEGTFSRDICTFTDMEKESILKLYEATAQSHNDFHTKSHHFSEARYVTARERILSLVYCIVEGHQHTEEVLWSVWCRKRDELAPFLTSTAGLAKLLEALRDVEQIYIPVGVQKDDSP